MPISISGSIVIPVPRAEGNFIARIVPALAQELRSEKPGAVTEASDRVTYRRGYSFLPFAPNKFSSFDPGEFAFEVAAGELKISYRLGLGPYYLSFVLVPSCAGIAILYADGRSDILAISGGGRSSFGPHRVDGCLRVPLSSVTANRPGSRAGLEETSS